MSRFIPTPLVLSFQKYSQQRVSAKIFFTVCMLCVLYDRVKSHHSVSARFCSIRSQSGIPWLTTYTYLCRLGAGELQDAIGRSLTVASPLLQSALMYVALQLWRGSGESPDVSVLHGFLLQLTSIMQPSSSLDLLMNGFGKFQLFSGVLRLMCVRV